MSINLDCIQASISCPVWNLEQCIQVCKDANVETSECVENESPCTDDNTSCCKNVTACIIQGDTVVANTCINPEVAVGSLVYFSGVISGDVEVPENNIGQIEFSANGTTVTAQIILTEVNGVITFAGAADLSQFEGETVDITITINDVEAEGQLDLRRVGCKCTQETQKVTSTITIGEEEPIVATFTIPDSENPPPFNIEFQAKVSEGTVVVDLQSTLEGDEGDENCGNKICAVDDEAKLTLNTIVPTVEGSAIIKSIKSADWCVCKTACFCPGKNGDEGVCTRSPGFFSTHGPDFGGCADCQTGNNENEWPEDVEIVIGGQELTDRQLCFLLNPQATNPNQCASCDLSDDAVVLIRLLRFYITVKLNLARGTLRCAPLRECLKKIEGIPGETEGILEALEPIFDGETLEYTDDLCNLNLDDDTVDTLQECQEVFDDYVKGSLEDCDVVHCEDENSDNEGNGEEDKDKDKHKKKCPCPHPTAAYTLTLTREGKTKTKTKVTVTVSLSEDCPLAYEKTFTLTLLDEQGQPIPGGERVVVFVPNGETTRVIVFEDLEITAGAQITARLSWTNDIFNLTTCEVETGESRQFIETVPFTVREECVNNTESTLTDTITTTPEECEEELLTPPCDSTDPCDRFAIENTSIEFEFDENSPDPFVLCEDGERTSYYDKLVALLRALVEGDSIDPDTDFNDLLGLPTPSPEDCSNPPYDMVTIKYVLGFEPCVCIIENKAKVTNKHHNSTTISTSEVRLENPKCEEEKEKEKEKEKNPAKLAVAVKKQEPVKPVVASTKKQPVSKAPVHRVVPNLSSRSSSRSSVSSAYNAKRNLSVRRIKTDKAAGPGCKSCDEKKKVKK